MKLFKKKHIFIVLGAGILSSAYSEEGLHTEPAQGKVYFYKKSNGVDREIEVFFPKGHDPSRKPGPGIIMFHGGGWGGGSRKQFQPLCRYFASRGVVAATVTYQLASKSWKGEGSRKRVCITDAKSAIRWYKEHAADLGIDPLRIVAGGGSAGGHISLLATPNPGLNDPQDPKGFDTSVAAYLLFNPALSADDAQDPDVNFLDHLKADFPPAIVFFGSDDSWLKKGWNPAYAKMETLEIKTVDLRIANGQGHAFFNKPPWVNVTLVESDKFLTQLGYLEGKPTLPAPKAGEKLIKSP